MESEKRVDIISFMAPVNDVTISRLIDLAYTAHSEGSSEIRLLLSSVGVSKLHSAFTAYHFFRSVRIPFITHNIGSIESAALLLYLSSDCRFATPNSKFVFNNFEWTFYRDHIRYPEIVEAYESLSFDVRSFSEIFAERTNQGMDVNVCLTGPAQVLGAESALRAGIVNQQEIRPPEIPELAKLWSIHN